MNREAIFVACAQMPEGDGDDTAAAAALDDLGFGVRWAVWDDPGADFSTADLVVLRATWDYPERRAEFLDWCETVPTLANPAAVVRWNTDKAYLVELLDAGVPTVPTTLVEPGEQAKWPKVPFVVKPSVGAGSRGAARFGADAAGAAEHLRELHADGRTAVVQPYQSSVDSQGEIALVYFGGVYSHAFTKGAMLGAGTDPSGLFLTEKLAPAVPASGVRAVAEDALDAACSLMGILRAELLYARADIVRGEDGHPLVLELELAEPSLGFRNADAGAPLRFASAVRQQLA
ncbi:ATP-grasp domain-containing protein [Amycolatopsis sp. CA-161197]|uniref:ATP-grasp domain-containing protein n=1 Tax=unclassified Amycolatopsis TaxID=2618356 RepID=UPI00345484D5